LALPVLADKAFLCHPPRGAAEGGRKALRDTLQNS